jgi:hypothetical protein
MGIRALGARAAVRGDPAGGGSRGPRGKPEAGVLWRGQQVIAAGYGRVGVDIGIGSLSVYP